MKLGIVIPTYDSLATLKTLVKNIFDYTIGDYRIYIIEDGQKQETIDYLKTIDAHCILHAENRGVASSWNDGIRQAMAENCDYIAVLNDDIELPPGWWDKCQEVITPKTHALCLNAPCPIPLTGWFFILDRYCIEKVGYFDEQFYPYCAEDDDYCYRMNEKGIRFYKINLDVFHHGSATIHILPKNEVLENIRANRVKLKNKYPNQRIQIL